MRLDKYIANSSDFSRKQVKLAIKQGSVSINHELAKDAGQHIGDNDVVCINGARLSAPSARYIMLNKPQGYICATKDKQHSTVIDLLIDETNTDKLHIAGRLDIDTTGLVLITDDGKWTHNIISPRKQCPKRYYVETQKPISETTFKYFERGIMLSGESKRCQPAKLELIEADSCILTIFEGKFHQVKRMFEAVDNSVTALHRLSISAIELDRDLAPGDYRPLTQTEIDII